MEQKQQKWHGALSLARKDYDSLNYEGTPGVKRLVTNVAPVQIFSEDYPKHQWPISGGWGYSIEDAMVIEVDDSDDGVALEYKILEYRSYEEGIIFRPKGQRLAGFRFKSKIQFLVEGEDGRHYDHVVMEVTAFREEDFEFLKSDWESHNCYEDDPEGELKHFEMAETKKVRYEVEGYFDITRFYGK